MSAHDPFLVPVFGTRLATGSREAPFDPASVACLALVAGLLPAGLLFLRTGRRLGAVRRGRILALLAGTLFTGQLVLAGVSGWTVASRDPSASFSPLSLLLAWALLPGWVLHGGFGILGAKLLGRRFRAHVASGGRPRRLLGIGGALFVLGWAALWLGHHAAMHLGAFLARGP